jgi:hypothetical protein
MTSPAIWDPYADHLGEDEHQLSITGINYNSHLQRTRFVLTITTNLRPISASFDDDNLLTLFRNKVIVNATAIVRKGTETAKDLADKWVIGFNAAQRTLEQSTQRGVRDFTMTEGYKRMKHTAHQLMYRHIHTSVYTDAMFNKMKSLKQNTCAQIHVTSFHWTQIYPMRTKADAHLTLDQLHQDVGVFHTIIPDNALELTEGEFRKKAIHAGSRLRPVETYMHNQNLAESEIRELRRMYRKAMTATNAPQALWDCCLCLMVEIRLHTALDLPELQGDTPYTRLIGDTADISHLCEFRWYDIVWYVDPPDKTDKKKLGRYLGPSHDIGQAMYSRILTANGTEISRTSVVHLSVSDKNSEIIKEKIKAYNERLKQCLGDRVQGIEPVPGQDDIPEYPPYKDNNVEPQIIPEADDFDIDSHHNFISSKVMIPQGGQIVSG